MTRHLALILASLSLLGACSNSVPNTGTTTTPATTTASPNPTITTAATRQCTSELYNVVPATLGDYFGHIVSNIEGPTTYCLNIQGGGSDLSGSTIRIEYEDSFGVRVYQTDATNYYYGSITTAGTTSTIEVVFIDDYGFTRVKGTSANSSTFTGTVVYYNFPSYSSALSAAVTAAQTACQNGTYTVAECLGYNFPPTYWWNQTYTTQTQAQQTQAETILNDTTKSKTLGTISASLTSIMQ